MFGISRSQTRYSCSPCQRMKGVNSIHYNSRGKMKTELSYRWCIATITQGYKLWHQNGRKLKTLKLPNSVRNVNKKWGVSNGLVLSQQDTYAVAGIRF